jgi:hypothetical protein
VVRAQIHTLFREKSNTYIHSKSVQSNRKEFPEMNTHKWLIASGAAILVALAMLALVVGLTQAQGPGPGGDVNEVSRAEAAVANVIPIQGRLTDDDGNPIDGTRVITFSLYPSYYATTPVCQDDDLVSVDNGLFMAEMDWCYASDIDGKQLYLGIQVEGDDEMTQRKGIYPVPYAFSLRPGAEISASLASNAILHIENWGTAGRGLRAYAMDSTSANFGVVGASRSPAGFGGYFYNNGGGVALYGHAITETGTAYGVHGETDSSAGRGVYGESPNASGGIGVEGSSAVGSGVYGSAPGGYGVYGETGLTSHNYGLFTPDNLYSLNYNLMGAVMQVVQNSGEKDLEPGDVVAFGGIGAPLEAGGQPVIQVVEATSADSTAVAGVVYSGFNIEALSAGPEEVVSQITAEGSVSPGEYLLVVVQGPAQVKASALTGSIQPGDLLSSAGQAGHAAKATEVTLGDIKAAMPGTVLGKALEPLDEGKALIYVFVTLQ